MKTENNILLKLETEGFEDAQQEIEMLAEAYDGFPAQVTIKNCHHCKINIYPSQTKFVNEKGSES